MTGSVMTWPTGVKKSVVTPFFHPPGFGTPGIDQFQLLPQIPNELMASFIEAVLGET